MKKIWAVISILFLSAVLLAACGSGGGDAVAPGAAGPTSKPAAPTGVTATPASTQVTLAWTGSAGASSYNVYWSLTTGVTPTSAGSTKITGASNPYIHTGRTNGESCYYVVTAVNALGESPASSQASATPVITAPTSPVATPGNGTVTLSWTAVAGATSYNVYWSITTGVTQATGTQITGATSPYLHTPLSNGTHYYYVITALDASGQSPDSAQVDAIPAALPPPAAPTNVVAAAGNARVTLSWPAVTNATSYNVYWSTVSGTGTGGTKITGATSPYTHTGRINGTPLYYVVTAQNANGESTASSQANATPVLPVPSGVTATPSPTQVALSWTAVPGATSYNVYWRNTTGVTKANGTQIHAGAGASYSHTSLTNGTDYYYVVTAVDASSESADSAQVHAVPAALPPPAAPTTVVAQGGNTQVTLTWTASAGATSYNVYWSMVSNAGTTGSKITNATSPYTHTGRTNGTPYYYVVTAQNANGESVASAQATATSALAPFIFAWVDILTGPTPPSTPNLVGVYIDNCSNGTPLTNATVTVNGTPLTYNAGDTQYYGNVTVPLGGAVTVTVIVNGNTYSVSGTQFTAFPTISAPTSGATWNSAIANTMSWSGGAPTTGAGYAFGILDTTFNIIYPSTGEIATVPITTTSHTIPANSLLTGGFGAIVGIESGNIPIPNACSGSSLNMAAFSWVPITVN